MNFNLLMGKRSLGQAYWKDYTQWAEDLLRQNVDSKNVAILASLGLKQSPDSEEIEFYFQKAMDDCDLTLPTERDSLSAYARYICEQVAHGTMAPNEGLDTLQGFYTISGYEPIYSIWDELSEDIWLVNDREEPIFNTGLTKDNQEEYIMNVAAQFLELLEIDLPDWFFHLFACPACGYIGKSGFERIDKPWLPEKTFKLIYRRDPARRAVCAKCGAPFPKSMGDYEGRTQYLQSLY